MRVLIAGGGSGGHLFPALAVAEELRRRRPDAELLFIGTERGLEARIVPMRGYQLEFIEAEGFVGKSLAMRVRAIYKSLTAFFRSREIIRDFGPDVVLGTGGYASVAPVAAAASMRVPTMVMEQNVVPGFANRVLSRLATAIAVTYHESLQYLPREKAHLTGNPVRREILEGETSPALELFSLEKQRLTVFVSGGSSGARSINNAMISALNFLLDLRDNIQFLHQSGERDYEGTRKAYRELGFKAMVAPFIHQMADAYAAGDLSVSRAGATTIAELTALGMPAIVVPYPHAAGHQEFNARKLETSGAGVLIEDAELSGERLAREIRRIVESEELRSDMRSRSLALGRPDAAQRVVDLALCLAHQKSHAKGALHLSV